MGKERAAVPANETPTTGALAVPPHSEDAPLITPPLTTQHSPLKWFLRLGLGLLILVLLLRRSGGQTWRVLQSVPWPVVLAAVAGYWAGQVLSVVKWRLLLRAQGAQISFRECCRLYLVGMFWNLWMPTNVGGDAVRTLLAGPLCGGRAVAVSSILVERLTGFAALLAISAAGLLAGAAQGSALTPGLRAILTVGALFACGVMAIVVLRAAVYRYEAADRRTPLLRKTITVYRALDVYATRQRRGVLVASLFLSLVFQASQVLLNIGLATAVGLRLPPTTMWWLVPVLSAASLLPVSVGGLGVREAAAVSLLHGTGAASVTIVAWSLLWQVTVWLASLPGAWWSVGGDSGENGHKMARKA